MYPPKCKAREYNISSIKGNFQQSIFSLEIKNFISPPLMFWTNRRRFSNCFTANRIECESLNIFHTIEKREILCIKKYITKKEPYHPVTIIDWVSHFFRKYKNILHMVHRSDSTTILEISNTTKYIFGPNLYDSYIFVLI